MKKLLILLLFPTFIFSQKWEADITLGTFHYNRYYMYELVKYDFNEFNPGVILYRNINNFKIGGGVLINSYGRVGNVAGIGYDFSDKVSVLGGIATGYEDTDIDKKVYPMAMITYKIGRFKVGASPAFLIGMYNIKL
jgi:hypothetical protein